MMARLQPFIPGTGHGSPLAWLGSSHHLLLS